MTQLTAHAAISTNSAGNWRHEDDAQGFQPSPQLIDNLQRILVRLVLQRTLVDLIELRTQGKLAHWNRVGTNFRDLQLHLEELVDFAHEAADTIAERMYALDAVPGGGPDAIVATTSLSQFPAAECNTTEVIDIITTRIDATVDTLRTVHDAVDAEDPHTADILHEHIDGLEKLAWLIKSENGKA